MKKKILVVDDDRHVFEGLWLEGLTRYSSFLELVFAVTIKEAEELFNASSFDLIVMDACVHSPNRKPNTIELIKKFKATHQKSMVAISGVSNFQKELMNAGCTHKCEKQDLPNTIIKIFNLESLHP